MPTKKQSKLVLSRVKAGLMAGLVTLTFSVGAVAFADTYDNKINELRNQNSLNQSALTDLTAQAVNFQATINQLASQIAALQAEIRNSQAEQARIEAEIVANQQLIDKKKLSLGASIKAMYLDGAITTIEQLATSKSLSEYIDKEEYRSVVQSQLSETIDEINALQAKLAAQKAEVELLIERQQEQNQQLASNQAEQARLLTYNQDQQNQFTAQIQSNNDNITKLKQAQAAELARRYGSSGGIAGGGGYPWGNARCIHTGSATGPCYNYDWEVNGNIYNFANGGYGYRNCTDWVAWRAGAPAGLGNANTWAARSQNVSSTPKQGDAAVDEYGTYGHVMYVEGVYDGGTTISVSDYNRIGDGLYRVTSLTKVGEGYYRSPEGFVNYLKFVTFD